MKTAELTAAALDYWVGRGDDKVPVIRKEGDEVVCKVNWLPYAPSTEWRQGGPLIEREKIMIAWNDGHWIAGASDHVDQPEGRISKGSTALEAAMRAFVQSKFGDQVL